ncbi:MAG: hypothetical protein V4613_04375 [Bacteroidota bacterium]
MKALIINQIIEFIVVHCIAFTLGIMVLKKGWRVNYTRKINHFTIFFSPYIIRHYFPYPDDTSNLLLSVAISLSVFLIYIKPVRNNIPLFSTMFASFDRPEDRPHTLRWLFIQYLATYIVAVPFYLYFHSIGHQEFMIIIIFINAFGDGLAEPIGVKFGKHKYKVRALFTKNLYTRSYEGSACVFISSILVILGFQHLFNPQQLFFCLLILPIAMTLAKAFAPHTIDSPFIFLTGGIVLSCIYMI